MLFLDRLESMIQSAAQLRQSLWKRLPCATDLLFAPALPLADHGVHALLCGDELLIALRNQFLGLALSAIAGCLNCVSQPLPRVCQILLDFLKLLCASPLCSRPQPGQHAGR